MSGMNEVAPYGYCPICGAKGSTRERRPNGNDRCEKGHTYASAMAWRTPDHGPDVAEPAEPAAGWVTVDEILAEQHKLRARVEALEAKCAPTEEPAHALRLMPPTSACHPPRTPKGLIEAICEKYGRLVARFHEEPEPPTEVEMARHMLALLLEMQRAEVIATTPAREQGLAYDLGRVIGWGHAMGLWNAIRAGARD